MGDTVATANNAPLPPPAPLLIGEAPGAAELAPSPSPSLTAATAGEAPPPPSASPDEKDATASTLASASASATASGARAPPRAGKGKGKAPPPPPVGEGRKSDIERMKTWPITAIVQRALTGDEITIKTSANDTFFSLKVDIQKYWNLPTVCQKIMTQDGIICEEEEHMRKYCSRSTPTARFVMLLTDSDALLNSQSDEPGLRYGAAAAFTALASHCSPEAMTSLLQLVHDSSSIVRVQAAQGLAVAAQTGDTRAIYALGECMGLAFQDDLNKATHATEALAYLTSEGNEAAWTVLSNCLDNPLSEAASQAVKVLGIGTFFYKNARALSCLNACLEHRISLMREAAIVAVAFAAPKGDVQAIGLLVARLDDEVIDVRDHAIAGLGQVAEVGNSIVKAKLLSMLSHSKESWSRILVALSKVVQRGDVEALAAVQNVVKSLESSHFALTTYAKLAEHMDETVISVLMSRAADPDAHVRTVVVLLISSLAPHDDERVMPLLNSGAQDRDIDVRIATANATARLARAGNQEAFVLLDSLKDDEEQRVKSATQKLIGYLQNTLAGDWSAKRALEHAFTKLWRRWSVDDSLSFLDELQDEAEDELHVLHRHRLVTGSRPRRNVKGGM